MSMSERLALLLVFTIIFMWIYVALRLHFSTDRRLGMRKQISIYFIEALLISVLLFAIYFGVFITVNEWQVFEWEDFVGAWFGGIYYMLLPEWLMFFLLVILFFVEVARLPKLKK